jgi:ATP-dependent RNA helicase DDX42
VDDEVDPLDAFMSEVSQEVKANKPSVAAKGEEFEEEDIMDGYEHTDGAGPGGGGDNSDEEVYAAEKRADRVTKEKEAKGGDDDVAQPTGVLAKVDHSQIEYMPFRRDFYKEHPEVAAQTDAAVAAYKKELDISVTWLTGGSVPRPVQTFKQAGFPVAVMKAIEKAGYEKPSAVQAQAWPALLSGRDVIGIAKTGSGKTASFVLPGLVHLMDQPELQKNEGPIMVVLAPTRELAAQIYTETKKFSKGFGLKIGAIYGGMSKFEQFKVLKAGVEAVVATPGRLIDLIKMKGTSLGAHRPAEYLAHPVSVSDSPGTSLTGVLTLARSPLHVRRVRRGGSDVEYGL